MYNQSSLRSIYSVLLLIVVFVLSTSPLQGQKLMKYTDVFKLPADSASARISYGEDQFQFGDLRIPTTKGPHKVVVIIHGGCWVSAIADLSFNDAMASQLAKDGYATWNLEYRRIGDLQNHSGV